VKPSLYGGLIALVTRTWSRQHTVMLLAGLGYSVSYFVQSKGFVYHAYPVLVCSVTFLGICLGQGLTRAWTRWRKQEAARVALCPWWCCSRSVHQAGSR
jgi:dolichyl-phosphate-mannose--protein O-mannosyl transferase